MRNTRQVLIRFTPDDDLLVEAIKAKLGVVATSEVVRMALRAFAAQNKVVVKKS